MEEMYTDSCPCRTDADPFRTSTDPYRQRMDFNRRDIKVLFVPFPMVRIRLKSILVNEKQSTRKRNDNNNITCFKTSFLINNGYKAYVVENLSKCISWNRQPDVVSRPVQCCEGNVAWRSSTGRMQYDANSLWIE